MYEQVSTSDDFNNMAIIRKEENTAKYIKNLFVMEDPNDEIRSDYVSADGRKGKEWTGKGR